MHPRNANVSLQSRLEGSVSLIRQSCLGLGSWVDWRLIGFCAGISTMLFSFCRSPSGAEAHSIDRRFAARLKPRPFKALPFAEFLYFASPTPDHPNDEDLSLGTPMKSHPDTKQDSASAQLKLCRIRNKRGPGGPHYSRSGGQRYSFMPVGRRSRWTTD
jgi:hypothetical protein